jgi:hypothetical protein
MFSAAFADTPADGVSKASTISDERKCNFRIVKRSFCGRSNVLIAWIRADLPWLHFYIGDPKSP